METSKKTNQKNGDMNENDKNSKDESRVNMEGFRFFANTCEEKLKLFLENFFCNKKNEELKYLEENTSVQIRGTDDGNHANHANHADNNCNGVSDDSRSRQNGGGGDCSGNDRDNDSSNENEKSDLEKINIIKSNYDKMAISLVDEVEQFMKSYVNERYKIVVQGIIGENKKQGVHIASKSLWNVETDNYISAKYVNDFVFATVMVFLLYNE
ncbi:dynein light chain 2, putative [Plasmodium ovale wallikeri]|uniref:Dynein light chain 2, putative n=2 Tax=Plasmodium ovale TaxID=36330 RepID=A0A1A8YU61_PLAOA|nr:dynein light chain 2, putative [Plasmodium ovale wallikeri]SBT35485.1 dynein light chain 2, putative [Plasmodium ovale wallikeri]SBT77021.1 dynein light chain type 2, putative [Plasmodium ovale]